MMNSAISKSLIVVGASGVGKGTIIKQLKLRHPGLF
jgi:guanylate kinase